MPTVKRTKDQANRETRKRCRNRGTKQQTGGSGRQSTKSATEQLFELEELARQEQQLEREMDFQSSATDPT